MHTLKHRVRRLAATLALACAASCQTYADPGDVSDVSPATHGSSTAPAVPIAADPVAAAVPEAPTFEPATWFLTDPVVRVGFATVGGVIDDAPLVVRELGGHASDGAVQVEVRGPFEVDGSFAPLEAREVRQLVVRFTGDTDAAGFHIGSAIVTIDGDQRHVWLSAVVGERDLPPTEWVTSELGTGTIVPLDSAPFPHKDMTDAVNAVLIFVPDGFDPAGEYGVVVHFHGHFAELHRTLSEQRILEQFNDAHRQAILIAPQGPLDRSDSTFGRVQTDGGLRDLVEDVVALAFRDGIVQRPLIETVVLSAHSGGYEPVAVALRRGGLPIAAVHLFDAMYGFEQVFRDYAIAGGVLRSMYTPGGATQRNNLKLASRLALRGVLADRQLVAPANVERRVTIARTPSNHTRCIVDDDMWRRWLELTPLPPIADDTP